MTNEVKLKYYEQMREGIEVDMNESLSPSEWDYHQAELYRINGLIQELELDVKSDFKLP